MSEGWRMWAISFITIMLLTLLSAAPIDITDDIKKEDVKADNDAMHSHDENVIREGKFFGHNQFDIGNINVPGSIAGDDVSIGHQVNIDVQGHTHDHHHHEDDTVIECKEGLREMFKSIDSNKDGLMDAMELLRVCHRNNIQITKPLAVRILTLPDKTVGFNIAKFCELLKDCPSTNSADSIYFLLQLFDKVCKAEEFSCSSGECIYQDFRCDGGEDCSDASDEIDCEKPVCTADQFSCSSGDCIKQENRCDGVNDCKDGSDESNCPSPVCTAEEFSCSSGQCIDADFECDGEKECHDGSDEMNCEIPVCTALEFTCSSGQCIDKEFECDNLEDCYDGSDEIQCGNSEKRRKRSTQTLTVSGKIILPANLDFTFPTNSRVYVSCDDISNQQSTNLGIAVIDVSNKPSEEDISYVLEADLPKSKKMTMSATINVGWNRDTNKEWIRKGDFHNDVSYSLYVVKDTAEYEKDISVVLYN